MPDIPFWVRFAALIAFLASVAGIDLWYRRQRATRWKEYLFILATGCAGAVFGAMTDMVTSSISPEYFIFGKGLPAEGIRWSAMTLGLQAGFSAGAIAGALCLFIGVRKLNDSRISLPTVAMFAWRPFVLAVIFAAVFPFAFVWFDPLGLVESFTKPLGAESAEKFLTVWHIHLGVYLGLTVGAGWMIVKIRRISNTADNLLA
ncbi:MAG: hypothetical protein GY794_00810 [bacterium]|nr:hypothetical protein [bacterium]